jgi:hypothetical protein
MAADDTNNAVPPAPMPSDRGRWRVTRAPDGRGTPEEHRPRPPHRPPRFWIVNEADTDVTGLLTEQREQLDSLTHALLEAVTLDARDAYAAAAVVTTRTTVVEAITSADVA